MDVERMHFACGIYDAPVLHGSDWCAQHGSRIHGKLLPVDIETILVFAEDDGKVWNLRLDGFQLPAGKRFVNSWAANARASIMMIRQPSPAS